MTTTLFGDLAGDLTGEPGRRPPLVLLHGLTFDRTSWHPVLAELNALDPGRPVLALDLPGHCSPPAVSTQSSPSLASVHSPGAGAIRSSSRVRPSRSAITRARWRDSDARSASPAAARAVRAVASPSRLCARYGSAPMCCG